MSVQRIDVGEICFFLFFVGSYWSLVTGHSNENAKMHECFNARMSHESLVTDYLKFNPFFPEHCD